MVNNQIGFLMEDIKRWKTSNLSEFIYGVFELGLWATIIYRFNRIIYLVKIPIIRQILNIFAILPHKFSEMFLGVRLPSNVEIGPGLLIAHTGTIVIHHSVKIGKNLTIRHGVTIGQKGSEGDDNSPTIGNNVDIGAGAQILGGIKIGNNVKIGANAVVIRDVPDNCIAVGVPAVIKELKV